MSGWVGKMLGKVRIDSLLARGGVAEVYLGEHVALQREVAVKILRNQYEDDPELLERFQREARVVARLRHPNIVQVFDFDTIDSHPYLVMEYVPGLSLSRYLHVHHEGDGRLELPVVSRILTKVAGALQYAHESGVIHRDVKPGNILLTSRAGKIVAGKPLPGDFEPILTDFGLVRFLNSSRQTSTGFIAGTPAYMSPEQARGEPSDERTDIYSLGIVLYEMLSGHVPFEGETTMSTIGKHANEPPPPIPGLSDPLAKILDRALAKKADDRFQTPIDLANEFNAIIEERAESTTFMVVKPKTDPVITKVRVRTKSRMKWIPRLLGVITFILLGALILLKSFPIPNQPSESKTPTQTSPSSTTEIPSLIPLPLGPTGVLHFQDGTALINQATIAALAMPIPPRGSHYEVWLVNEGQRRSLGILMLDANGRGELTNQDETGNNLLSLYDRVEITIEPDTDTDPGSSGLLAYSFTLPPDGLIHVRHLLVSFPDAPNGTALIQGLNTDVNLISQTAREMQTAFLKGDEIATRQNAEAIFNILVGDQNQSYKDWNADGQTADPGDGFGLLLNGTNPGYIQSVYSHADYAVISPGATQNMIIHGEEVKTCAQNLAQWASQLRDRVLTILTSTSGSDLSQPIQDSVILADRLLTGVDLDGDKIIEPILGECGEITTYEHAYSMADMPLLPVSLPGTSTAISNTTTPGNGIIVQPTRTRERVGKTPTASPTPGPPTKKPTNTPKTPKKKN